MEEDSRDEYWRTRLAGGLVFNWRPPALVRRDSCVSLMHVCRLWRDVILDLPYIWSRTSNLGTPASCILRSKQYPLTVVVDEPLNGGMRDVLENHIHRSQSLYWPRRIPLAYEYVTAPAPMLRNVSIGIPFKQTFTASNLFSDCTPSLQRLALSGFHPLPHNTFHDLTCLLLHKCQVDPHQLLSWMAASPRLKDLMLNDNKYLPWSGVYPATEPLRNLQKLKICTESTVDWLLSHPALSEQTTIDLNVWPPEAIPLSTFHPASYTFTKILLRRHHVAAFGPFAGLRICFHDGTMYATWALHVRIPLHQITELWIDRSPSIEVCREILYDLTALESVTVSLEWRLAISSLCSSIPPSTAAIPTNVPCPNLRVLRILFSNDDYLSAIFKKSTRNPPAIANILAARAKMAHPLRLLVILCSDRLDIDVSTYPEILESTPISWEPYKASSVPEMEIPDVCRESAPYWWDRWN
ncbi:hypothetical protein CERSUDRAFT_77577 [Gelatoporia subvermispora B]|uniref:F-box domain-containing protein n=1 Tax=Ceriporiopsis subvermispora (strain B) TaxID=914234 RepID=M2QJI1_CERS8|nr:hypothetical protein CERSUDRAFT_77577 [Gelatoporia subvermispora B]